ncbi:MAG: phosphoribosyltransferase family protein [Cyclobacteriaceae bacterium]
MRFTLWEDFLSLVFPVTCCVCRRSLFSFEDHLCKICIARLPITSYHLIPFENDLKVKLLGLAPVDRAMAFLRFSKRGMSQRILHQLKYKNKPGLGIVLGRIYGQLLLESGYADIWDLVIPVPLHQAKLRKRGYNQSEQFAIGLAQTLHFPKMNLLIRSVPTPTQTNKSRIQRWENVSNVFQLEGLAPQIEGKRILLVDDVMTTGATLAACALSLNQHQPLAIDMAVIAAGK